jgi:hypothetical protein
MLKGIPRTISAATPPEAAIGTAMKINRAKAMILYEWSQAVADSPPSTLPLD